MGSACRRGHIERWRREQLGAESIHRAAIEVDHQIYRQSDLPTVGTLDRQAESADKKAMFVPVAGAQYDVALGQPCIETHGLAPARRVVCDRHRFLPNAACGVEILWKFNVQQDRLVSRSASKVSVNASTELFKSAQRSSDQSVFLVEADGGSYGAF